MMKCGGIKKPSSDSSSSGPSSFISHVPPFSWLSKFKHMTINSKPSAEKLMKQKVKQNSPSLSSPRYNCWNGGRFHGGDKNDAAFCRLSFGKEGHEDNKRSKDILKSEVYNLDDENFIPSSSCPSGKRRSAKKHGRTESTLKFKEEDIIGVGEERKLLNDSKVSQEMDEYNREKEFECLRRRFEKKAERVFQEQLLKLEREADDEVEFKTVEKEVLQLESPRTICTPRLHYFEKTDRISQKKLSSERKNLKQTEELKFKTNKQKQSINASRELQRRKPKRSSKVRVYSPRLASKIKALEDMRKAKLKVRKEKEEIVEETRGVVDSFAVIKCSMDPQKDFRDSMIEMITEKQIRQPEEMEELLACYLTLNADEYHDLIIEVFRQVWFDMSRHGLGIKLDKQCCFYD